jgi:hypothetical protein
MSTRLNQGVFHTTVSFARCSNIKCNFFRLTVDKTETEVAEGNKTLVCPTCLRCNLGIEYSKGIASVFDLAGAKEVADGKVN